MITKYAPFIKAILYADIFDYPLRKEEVWRFAIGDSIIEKSDFTVFLNNLPSYIKQEDGYFYLTEREVTSKKRRERHIANLQKMAYAQSIATELSKIPTIQFIGVSGGLSLYNAQPDDDIDFFIITTSGTLWLTRLLTTLALDRKGIRRTRKGRQKNNRICINMFVDGAALAFGKKRHDLYTAHEVVQLVPIVNKQQTYERFLAANSWVQTFLPNAITKHHDQKFGKVRQFHVMPLFEGMMQQLQLWYMKRHMTREEVSDTILAFHPVDYRKKTLDAFAKRLALYEKI